MNNVSLVMGTDNDPALNLTPLTTTYDVKGDKTGFTPGNTLTDPITHTGALTEKDATYVLAHHFYTSYYYIQPGTTSNQVSVSFTGGELYDGINMTGKYGNVYRQTTPTTFATNKSYTLVIKLRPLLYLFNDGSNGVLSEKGSRTPIGIVTWEKTKNHEGTAAGLKVSPMALKWEVGGNGQQRNITVHNKWWNLSMGIFTGSGTEFNGYDLTWTGTGTTDNKKRAEEPTQYPAFHWVSTYNPGVSTSNIGKWYIPAHGEIMAVPFDFYPYTGNCLVRQFGKGGGESGPDPWSSVGGYFGYNGSTDAQELFDAFTNAGGTLLSGTRFWTASTSDGATNFRPIVVKLFNGMKVATCQDLEKDANDIYVLPYVHF